VTDLSASSTVTGTEIAIVGLTGRFPGARDLAEFWHNLSHGIESIRPISDDELRARGVSEALWRNPKWVKMSAALEGMELFDASFFGYTPREAELLDPQQRIFLECAWEALEQAGYDPERYTGSIGVFAGASTNTYLLYNLATNPTLLMSLDQMQIDVTNGLDYLATRVSYKLNLKGPSYTLQTACSTSLVAVHVACQSLLNQECDMALAGGVSIHVKHLEGYAYLEGGVVAPDGHCRAFDAQAAGTVFGSGVGVVVLKRLDEAVKDGDTIYAVIRGSAINNDGSDKVGYTAPSVEGQASVITEALAVADVSAASIQYVEAHGTGTPLGDPIEIRALTKAYCTQTTALCTCAIGTVKTNIGHLSGAAGVSGLIKTVLALQHQQLPPSLNFTQPNPEIDFAHSPFYVNTQLTEWKSNGTPRRAGVSSFGVGGTNAHVILEAAPELEPASASRPAHLLLLSAKTPQALEAATKNLAQHLTDHPAVNLADVAYTLQLGRQAFAHRRAIVCRTPVQAIQALEGQAPAQVYTSIATSQDRPVVFMFPGGGAQYLDMGRELYDTEPVFREQLDRCLDLLNPLLGLDLRAVIYPAKHDHAAAAKQLEQSSLGLPALFAIEYAVAQLWMSWGIRPQAMIGHSLGEYTAACLAGVFSLPEALVLVVERGRLMEDLPTGTMLSVPMSEQDAQQWLGEELSIAAMNGPMLCTITGPETAIKQLVQQLAQKGIDSQRVRIAVASHSPLVTPILEKFQQAVSRLQLTAPNIPYLSNVTGTWITANEAIDPAYWARHLRQPVRFSDGIQELLRTPASVMLEVGPGRTMSTLTKAHLSHPASRIILSSLRHPQDAQPDTNFLLATLGRLWQAGVTIDWEKYYQPERRRRVALPTYPFERRRYWIEPGQIGTAGLTASATSINTQTADVSTPQLTLHERPSLPNTYVAPRTALESQIAATWQQVLGIEQVGLHDNFFDLGGHSLLATQLRNQLYETFKVDFPIRSLFENATVAGVAALIESAQQQATAQDERPIAERLRTAFPTERAAVLDTYVRQKVAHALNRPIDQLPPDGDLSAFNLDLLAVDLMWDLKQDFKLQFYPHEFSAHPQLSDLARYLLAQIDRMADLAQLATPLALSAYPLKPYRKQNAVRAAAIRSGAKNKPMVFLHSSPRAGSTLLRVMLAGHPDLFCPPELNLLFFEDMQEWQHNIGFGHELEWTSAGVQWAFMELQGLESEAGQAFVDDLVQRNESAQQVYARLQALAGPRLLVDKTPTYAMDLTTLQRAEELFVGAKYIYLFRHPYPVMDSLLRIRLDQLFGPSLFEQEQVDPFVVAETVWAMANRNLLSFFDQIGHDRCHWVRYEDLVSQPEQVMSDLCRFLEIPFHPGVLQPYDGRRERMIGGLGDPNILQHNRIESKLGEAWQKIKWPRPLDASTQVLIKRLGYALPDPVPPIETTALPDVNQLTDDQVRAMLENLLSTSEGR
jgi:phthiocerol/phenolphthiocerol synthesis type-I polyketide synthase E